MHLEAASHFALASIKAGRHYDNDDELTLEELNQDRVFQESAIYRANVIGTLFTSVAFLEAFVNEIFLDAVYSLNRVRPDQIIPCGAVMSLSDTVIRSLAQKGNKMERGSLRLSTLNKYNEALTLSNESPIDESNPKRNAVQTVIDFRHYLTHAKPEWITVACEEASFGLIKNDRTPLENQVKALINTDVHRPSLGYHHEMYFVKSGFPANCLNATLAKAAVRSCLEFANEFCRRMVIKEIETRYSRLNGLLSVLFE